MILWLFVFIAISIAAIQFRPVQVFILNNSLIDQIVFKLDGYQTLKKSIYNHFPGFAYSYIAIKVAGLEKNKEKIAQKISLYVHDNVFQPAGYKVIDNAPIAQLTRGVGWCDQTSHLFIRLIDSHNIPGHIEFLYNSSGTSPHTVSTVFIDNKWRVVDATYSLSFINNDNKVASAREVCNGSASVDLKMLKKMDLEWYKPLYCNKTKVFMKNEAAGENNDMRIFNAVKSNVDIPIQTVSDPWKLFFKLPDFIGSDLFINLYLISIESHYLNRIDYLYDSARTLHLLGKYKEAVDLYNKVIKYYPKSTHAEESAFFIGLSEYHSKQYALSVDYFKNFINDKPLSSWVHYARLYAAKSLIKLERYGDAEKLLRKVGGEAFRQAQRILYLNNSMEE